MNLGERYRQLRLSLRDENNEPISTRDFAENFVKLTAPRVSELENNKREMSLTELKAYHKCFGVSFEYLLGETDTMTVNEDIQTACKVTGLNEEAIKKIAQLKQFNLSAHCGGLKVTGDEIMNSLVLDQRFKAFIERLAMYYMRTRVIVYLVENKLNFSINEVDYERALAKLALFEVGQAANLIAENFKSPNFDEAVEIIEKLKTKFEQEVATNAEHNPTQE